MNRLNRRSALKTFTGAATAGLLAGPGPLAAAQSMSRRGLPPVKITDVQVILTQPAGDNLVVVKVLTDEPGLYGLDGAVVAGLYDIMSKSAGRSTGAAPLGSGKFIARSSLSGALALSDPFGFY